MKWDQIGTSVVLAALVCGCGTAADQGPFGPASESELLAPFAGKWRCDFEKTVARLEASGGATAEEIKNLRKLQQSAPALGMLHPDMEITGDIAVCQGDLSSEYRLFSIHEHDGKACGKAWYHEDRFDPGDMSKCYVRMSKNGQDLLFEIRHSEAGPDLDDPDLRTDPATEGGSADSCDADNPTAGEYSPWMKYVFVHAP